MHHSPIHGWRRWAAVCGAALALVGCTPAGPAAPAAPAAPDITIMLEAAPEGKEGTYLIVHLVDAGGAAITDADVALEGNMTHAGMVPVVTDAVADDADGEADGHYQVPFVFTMLGDWIVTVDVTLADGSTVSRDVDVQVAEEGVMVAGKPSAHMAGSAMDGVFVHEPKARPAPLEGGTGAVYFMLHNMSDAEVKLVGGESGAAQAVEIHETFDDNGTMRMRQLVDGLVLAPDAMANFAPGGLHVMLVNLTAPLEEGDTLTLTLHFEGADDVTVEVPVVSMDDLPADGEMNHNH